MVKAEKEHKASRAEGFWSRKWHFFLVLVFGAILSIGIWGRMDNVIVGDDFAFHVARLQSTSHAWSNGQIVPQVDPDALGGFGYAYNLFYGPLVTYVASGFQMLIQNWAITINWILILALVFSGLTMCYAVTKISKSRAIGALAGIFYMATPYVLTDLYFRAALGESLAFIAAPILLLGLYQLTVRQRNATRSLAVAAALLIFSHSLSALLFAMMAGVYVLINIDKLLNPKSIWRAILAVVVALGLTAVFTLPLVEAKLNGADYGIFDAEYVSGYFGADAQSMNDHRLWPARMLFDVSFQYNGRGAVIGLVAIFGLIGFFLIWRKLKEKQDRRFILSLFILAVVAIVLMTPVVDWNYVPSFFYKLQFPWRLLEIVALTTSVLAAYTCGMLMKDFAEEGQKVATLLLGMLAVAPVVWIFLPANWFSLENGATEWSEVENGSIGWQAEYAPTGMLCSKNNPQEKDEDYKCSLKKIERVITERGADVEILEGKVKLANVKKDGLKVEFDVNNETENVARVEIPLIYYPGYEAWLGDEELEVEASDKLGLVTVVIPANVSGKVEVFYGVSVPTQVGLTITLITTGVGLIWLVITGISDARIRKKEREITKLMGSVRDVIVNEDVIELEVDKSKKGEKKVKTRKPKIDAAKESVVKKANVKRTKIQAATTKRKAAAKKSSEKEESTGVKEPKKTQVKKKTGTTAAKMKASETTSLADAQEGSKITRVKATSRARKDPE